MDEAEEPGHRDHRRRGRDEVCRVVGDNLDPNFRLVRARCLCRRIWSTRPFAAAGGNAARLRAHDLVIHAPFDPAHPAPAIGNVRLDRDFIEVG